MRRRGPLVALAMALACTDTSLERAEEAPPPPRDDRLQLTGEFCTDEPEPLEFPLRVLFVVDVSQSMNITDPAPPTCVPGDCFSRRGEAVLEVLNAHPGGNGVEYALLLFDSASSVVSQDADGQDGFTADSELLKTRVPLLNGAHGETNYEGALDDAFQLLQRNMIGLEATARARARYIMVFLSDGMPAPVTADSNTPERIRNRVSAIKDLERQQRLAEVRIHTVYLAGPSTPLAVQLAAKELLADMAREGEGTTRTFEPGERLSFFYIDFRAFIRVFALKTLNVANLSARLVDDRTEADSDADGLLDEEEIAPGTDPASEDTDGDGFSDFLEVKLRTAGFDPHFPGDADCTLAADRLDDDGDGIRNCEERFLGTSPRLMDSDADGLPDNLEVRLGSNAVMSDYLADGDFDGAANGIEVASHTDPQAADTGSFSINAYRYDVREVSGAETPRGRLCYTFTVDNITLAPTTPPGDLPLGTNTILVQVASAPLDSPEDYGNHQIACVRPRYRLGPEVKEPPTGRMSIEATAFKKPAGDPADEEVFDAARDCVTP